MNYKFKLEPLQKRKNGWYWDYALYTDAPHFWIYHCSGPHLVAIQFWATEDPECPGCQSTPSKEFLQEAKLAHVLWKYELDQT